MQYPCVTLNDGSSMPHPIYGTGTTLRGKEVHQLIANAIRAGFRHIDCSQMYANEASVGRGIAESGVPRDELYITTKILPVPQGLAVLDTLRESLQKMKLSYVDLCLIHEPVGHRDLKGTWREMEQCKEEGLARSIGVSNFRIQDFEEILVSGTSPPVVNQIEYHPYVYKANEPLVSYMRERDIIPVSYSGQAPIARVDEGPLDAILPRIAHRLSDTTGSTVTSGQVLHLWLRKQGIPYISTTWREERLAEYLAVTSLPDLSDDDANLITEAGSTVHHRFFVRHYTNP